jgi:CRISPR-associated endonuclease/helicase Cas3
LRAEKKVPGTFFSCSMFVLMLLSIEIKGEDVDFRGFFTKATRNAPYAYQCLLAEREWPEVLIAPTGLGKTAAVLLAWLWRRRIAPEATPRRLVYCLPMRTLVEQTRECAILWLARLAEAKLDGNLPDTNDVRVLMGGMEKRRDQPHWYELPERPAILIGTQDMLLSRALMRGYAAARTRWPTEFALLHNDAQWVFDEVQLMGAGLPTSAQLHAFRARLKVALPSASLWVSATLDPEWLRTVDFETPRKILRVPDDVPEDAASLNVRRLIEASKPLSKATVAPSGEKKADVDNYVRALSDLVRKTRVPERRSLAIVNTVERAQKIYDALLNAGVAAGEVVLVHSRFRMGDRRIQMDRLQALQGGIVIATQAIEAGVDISSAILITELAPWSSLVQRFGRVNRYGEWSAAGGAPVHWVDLPAELAAPYEAEELEKARVRLAILDNAAPVHLGGPGELAPPRRVIRQKDLVDLFDTDSDLTGFDVDISSYVRDASDTDVRVFWRDLDALRSGSLMESARPSRDDLCAVSIGKARYWIGKLRERKLQAYSPDPQWRKGERGRMGAPPGWQPLDGPPWPGLTVLVDVAAGGYDPDRGFVGEVALTPVTPVEALPLDPTDTDQEDDDPGSVDFPKAVTLAAHTEHVVSEARALSKSLGLTASEKYAILRAARWHDLGKAHSVFQHTMRRGVRELARYDNVLLAKSEKQHLRHSRPYFRHELASALAFLAHEDWTREADFIAYLIASHHGKVRMSLRALPAEPAPKGEQAGARFARGIWDNDELPAVDLGDGETWQGGRLALSIMELGEDPMSGASWTERTRTLLDQYGPFNLAWLEAILTIADWRASGKERKGDYD